MKKALVLNTISPRIGGVLIQGEKGSAKSTAVRALQNLLPEISVVKDCPFHCDPRDVEEKEHCCEDCKKLAFGKTLPLPQSQRQVPFVNLPIGCTEDRLLGTLDVEHVIQQGRRRFQPGLLAGAHRGILYIDEVNLLSDHLVDALLDAAAMGVNVVERDGISVQHAASFILVGTMNPEEGELRPQLLDRFALSVDAERIDDPTKRSEIVARRVAFEKDPQGFLREWGPAEQQEREKIARAQKVLPKVEIDAATRLKISTLCVQAGVDGLRADIVIHKTAAALAAYHGRTDIMDTDIEEAAQLALMHRRRNPAPPTPPSSSPPDHSNERSGQQEPREGQQAPDKTFASAAPFRVSAWTGEERAQKISTLSHGRRAKVVDASTQGRVLRSKMPREKATDIHWNATLRQAAMTSCPHISVQGNLAVKIQPEDVRENVREKRLSHLVVFVVDTSGSMGARRRMEQTKGAILSLLLDSYQKRDQIAMIAFRGRGATVLLPPTRGLERARRCLEQLPSGGRTPLVAGLRKALEIVRPRTLNKAASCVPLVVLITDGKANAFPGEGKPQTQLAHIGHEFLRRKIRVLVIDTEEGFVKLGMAQRVGLALGAKTVSLGSLHPDSLARTVKGFMQ